MVRTEREPGFNMQQIQNMQHQHHGQQQNSYEQLELYANQPIDNTQFYLRH